MSNSFFLGIFMSTKTITAAGFLLAATTTLATAQNAPDCYFTGAIGASSFWEDNPTPLLAVKMIEGDFTSSPLMRIGVGHS